MTLPLVTILFPTIGRTEYQSDALLSLREQTYRNLDILVLDNASGHEAQRTLTAFAAATTNARILRLDQRVPMFANFNRGICAAGGKYVVFFHDDDYCHETFLERHVALLEASPRAAFAGGNYDVIDRAGRTIARKRFVSKTGTWSGRYFIERLCRRGRGDLPTPGLVFRREAIEARGFDEKLPIHWGDFTILMRMAEKWDVAVLADTLFSWRAHGANFSSMAWSQSIPLRTRVLLDYCVEYEKRHPDDSVFVRRLERFVSRGHRQGLVWGWLSATDEAEARACRELLQSSSQGTIASTLRFLELIGLTAGRRRGLATAVRHAGDRLGV